MLVPTLLLCYIATALSQGPLGPVWSPPLGSPSGASSSGASGPAQSNVSAIYSLGAGAGQPWQPSQSVAVAPYGQMVFWSSAPDFTLNSLSTNGGATNFRGLASTYFPGCSLTSGVAVAAPATDALRVYAVISCVSAINPIVFNTYATAVDSSSGAAVWPQGAPAIAKSDIVATPAPTLLVAGGRIWVGFTGHESPAIIDAETGAILPSQFQPRTANKCNLLTATFAVCSTSAAAELSETVVFSTVALPPTPAWSNFMLAEFIAADANLLIATTGTSSSALSLDGFDLATGALAWSLPCPWQGYGAAALAYDDAGTLFAAWMGYDAEQHFSAIVATYALQDDAAVPVANVSLPMFAEPGAIQDLVVDNSGKRAYLTVADNSTGTFIIALAATPTTLTVAATTLAAPPGTQLQGIPGPQNGQMIIGQVAAGGLPSLTVYQDS